MCKKLIFFSLFLLIHLFSKAQPKPSDSQMISLKKALNNSSYLDTNRINILNLIAYEFRNEQPQQMHYYAQQALKLAQKLKFKQGEAEAYRQIGIAYTVQRKSVKALENYLNGLQIAENIQQLQLIANLKSNIGRIYILHNNFNEANDYFKDALKINENLHNTSKIAANYVNIGEVNLLIGKLEEAKMYFERAEKIYQTLSAEQNNIALSKRFLGEIYFQTRQDSLSIKYLQESYPIAKATNNTREQSLNLQLMAKIYLRQNKLNEAERHANLALQVIQNTLNQEVVLDAKATLAQVYEALQQYDKAYKYQKQYLRTKDSLSNQKTENQILSLRLLYEKSDNQLKINTLQKEKDSQLLILYFLITVIILGLGLFWSFYRANQQKKRANELLQLQKQAIEIQARDLQNLNDEIYIKNKKLSQQNEEMAEQSSLLYETNIQLAETREEYQRINEELTKSNENLVERVNERTQRLSKLNETLTLANRELDSFVYRASHDFRSPIVTLLGLLNLTKSENDLDSLKSLLHLIENVVIKADSMLYKMLYINVINHRIIKSHLQIIDFENINERIERKLSLLDKYPSLQVEWNYDPDLQWVSDDEMVYIILENILENAVHFCAYNSNRMPFIKINIQAINPENIKIEILDNGLGIDPENLEDVFKMFFRGSVESKGNGIGLYVVKKAVQKLDGKISIASQLDEFTCVSLVLPNRVDTILS